MLPAALLALLSKHLKGITVPTSLLNVLPRFLKRRLPISDALSASADESLRSWLTGGIHSREEALKTWLTGAPLALPAGGGPTGLSLEALAPSLGAGLTAGFAAHQTMQGISQLASSRQVGGLIQGFGGVATGAGAALGGLAGGPPGALIGMAFGQLIDIVGKAVSGLKEWTEGLRKANFEFAEFSPAMARVAAETERRNVLLSRERGQRLAPSARILSEEMDKFNRGNAYFEDLAGRIQNLLGAGASRVGTWIQKAFATVNATNITILERILQALEKNAAQGLQLSVEDYFKQFGIPVPQEFQRPPRFRQPPQP